MKIIKAEPYIKDSYTLRCGKCKSIFEVQENEFKLEFFRNETYVKAECPICKHNVKL